MLLKEEIAQMSQAVVTLPACIQGFCQNKAKEQRDIPQHIGQQGLFLCLSYQVPVKDTPHLAQTLQTHARLKSSLNYPACSADKVGNVITIDLQSFVL